jgi:hypothetical protein
MMDQDQEDEYHPQSLYHYDGSVLQHNRGRLALTPQEGRHRLAFRLREERNRLENEEHRRENEDHRVRLTTQVGRHRLAFRRREEGYRVENEEHRRENEEQQWALTQQEERHSLAIRLQEERRRLENEEHQWELGRLEERRRLENEEHQWELGRLEERRRLENEEHRREREEHRRENEVHRRKLAEKDGTFFISLASVGLIQRPIYDLSDPRNQRSLDSIRGFNCAMKHFLPSIQDLQNFDCAMHNRGNIQVNFRYDIFGNLREMHQTNAEGAHILPHSKSCHRFFEGLNELRLGLDLESSIDRKRYDMFLYGRVLKGGTIKQAGSSFLGSALNIMAVQSQHAFFDQFPSGMYIPCVDSAEDLWKWDGSKELEYIVICDEAKKYVNLGATTSQAEVIASDDPRVAISFQVFGDIMSVAIALLVRGDAKEAPEQDNIQALWRHIQTAKQFASPVVAPGTRGYFLKILLGPAKLDNSTSWGTLDRHPSPDPINLICRSYNAFLTWLLNQNMLPFIRPSHFKACKLFPSCLDLPGDPDCSLCIAASLLHGPDYCCLCPEDREFLFCIVNLVHPGDLSRCRRLLESIKKT